MEEGLLLSDLEKILASMRQTCIEAGVSIVTGDTKVVEKGSLGGCVMNVSGIGKRTPALDSNLAVVRKYRELKTRWALDSNLAAGDKIILSGTIGDHGLAVLSAQQGLKFGSQILSDVKAPQPHDSKFVGEGWRGCSHERPHSGRISRRTQRVDGKI